MEGRLEEGNAQRPTLIILEEAWLYIAHEVFARKLKDWLKTLRKKNARVVFATQSLADLYDPTHKTLTPVTAALMESCRAAFACAARPRSAFSDGSAGLSLLHAAAKTRAGARKRVLTEVRM